MAQQTIQNADGSITTIFTDGSTITAPGGAARDDFSKWTYKDPQGNDISKQAQVSPVPGAPPPPVSASNAGSIAGQQFVHQVQGVPYEQISLPQPDGTVRPYTAAESNQTSQNANEPLGGGGILGLGGTGQTTLDAIKGFGGQVAGAVGGVIDAAGLGGGINTSDLAGNITAAGGLRDQFNNAYQNSQPGTAPVITPTELGPQTLASYLAAGPVAASTASNVDASGLPSVVAPTVGSVGPVVAGQATASQLDPTAQAQFRNQQQTLTGYLNDAITGKQPSVADLQTQQAFQQAESNQLGVAAAASRGGNSALAMRTAANNIARLHQAAAATGGLQRAQEIATAEGQMGGVLDQARGADVTIAGQNAALGTQTSIANAGNITGANTATAQTTAQLLQKQAELQYQASHDNAGNVLSAEEQNAKLQTDASLATALAQNQSALQTQREADAASTTNANNATTLAQKQADLDASAKTNNAANTLTQEQVDEKAKQDAAANALTASGQTITGGVGKASADAEAQKAKATTAGAIGTGLATLVSDRRAKTNVRDGEGDAQALLDRLTAKSYRYKDQANNGSGERTGVMAQDVEKAPAGKALVIDTPGGKMLDAGSGFGTVLAALAVLNKRLNKAEGRHGV